MLIGTIWVVYQLCGRFLPDRAKLALRKLAVYLIAPGPPTGSPPSAPTHDRVPQPYASTGDNGERLHIEAEKVNLTLSKKRKQAATGPGPVTNTEGIPVSLHDPHVISVLTSATKNDLIAIAVNHYMRMLWQYPDGDGSHTADDSQLASKEYQRNHFMKQTKLQLAHHLCERYENDLSLDTLLSNFAPVSPQCDDYGDYCALDRLTIDELERNCHAYRLEIQGPKLRLIRRILRHYNGGEVVLNHRHVPDGGPTEAQLGFVASLRKQLKDVQPPIMIYLNKFRTSEWIDEAREKIKNQTDEKSKGSKATYIGGYRTRSATRLLQQLG